MRIGLLFAIAFAATGCVDVDLPANLLTPGVEVDSKDTVALQQAVSACPGIVRYLPETRIVDVDHINDATVFIFSIPQESSIVPPEFLAGGNNCMLAVRPTGVGIAKRACVSICRERRINYASPPDSLEYPLN